MRIGVSTHIHVYSSLNREMINLIKDCGFESVEIYCSPPHWPEYANSASQREIASYCQDAELVINSLHTPFFRSLDEAKQGKWLSLSHQNQDMRHESVERAMQAVALAEYADIQAAVVHVGAADEKRDPGTWDRMYYSLEEMLPQAQQHGINLALENITNDFSRGHHIADFIKESGLPVGACYDSGHATIYRRTVEEYEELAPNLLTTHLHDSTHGKDNHLMPFSGEINWQALAEAIASSEYDGDLIIETKDMESSRDIIRAATEAAKRLREIILNKRAED